MNMALVPVSWKKGWPTIFVVTGVSFFILCIATGLTCLFTFMVMEAWHNEALKTKEELWIVAYKMLSHSHSRLEGEVVGYQKVIKAFASNSRMRPLGVFEVTAYDPSGCVPFNDGVTSIGMPIGEGIFAVNPKMIPYGSILHLHGEDAAGNEISIYGIAADTGGAMRKEPKLIDIFIPRNKDAKEFGRKKLNVTLVKF